MSAKRKEPILLDAYELLDFIEERRQRHDEDPVKTPQIFFSVSSARKLQTRLALKVAGHGPKC